MQQTESTSGNTVPAFTIEEQSLDQLVNKAVEAVAKGENVEQLMEVMLISLPADSRDKVRKKLNAALAKRGLRQATGEADIPSRTALARIREALALSTKAMVERIKLLVRSRPDLAKTIQQAGKTLLQNGVVADKVTMTEGDLGTIAPSAATALTDKDRGTRGA